MSKSHYPPLIIRRALKKLGQDIQDARLRRRLPAAIVAERAFTSRPTLKRIETGDHNVSIGIYASVLHALGLLNDFQDLASAKNDPIGLTLAAEELPKRARLRRPNKEQGQHDE